MNKQIFNLLQKMNEGNPMTQSELMRLIVYDLVEPIIPRKNSLIPAKVPNPQRDFILSNKGTEVLKNLHDVNRPL